MSDSPVHIANRLVPMSLACRAAGVEVPDRDAAKVYCPFGALYHPDGGHEAALRVYRDHAWCFAEQEYFSPCKLTALVWDCAQEDAALRLLDLVGYRPVSYAQHWEAASGELRIDMSALAQALRNYCLRLPGWETAQFEPIPAEYLARCLGFLSDVRTEEQAEYWLASSKQVMNTIIRRQHGDPGSAPGGMANAVSAGRAPGLHTAGH